MIRLLDNEDKASVMGYIERNETETSFLYANVVNIGLKNDMKTRRCADYYGFFMDGELKGILPFYNLGSCIPHYETDEAIPIFIELIRDRKFQHLLGMERVVKPLYEGVRDYKDVLSYDESSYFVNRSFSPFIIPDVELIDARETPVDDRVAEFLVRVRNVGFGENVTRDEAIDSINTYPEEDAVIAAVNGEFVAFAKIQTYTKTLGQIGSVYTEEAHRGKGYCKAAVSEICSRIVAKGKVPSLFARKNNIPAVRAYTSLGFKYFDDYLLIELGQ